MADSNFDPEGRGALFVNKKKTTDKQPDRVGDAQLDGRKIRISGWLKKTKAGDTFLSLSVKWDDQDQEQGSRRQPPPEHPANEDIPF